MTNLNDRIGSQNVIRVLSNASAPPSRLVNLTDVNSSLKAKDGLILVWNALDEVFYMTDTIDSSSLIATGIVTFSNTTESTSTTTGAVIVSGGVGIAKNLNVGGDAKIRVTKSGTPDTTSNYDRANKILRNDTTFSNDSGTNETFWYLEYIGNDVSEASNGIMYLFNFSNASEYSFLTMEITSSDNANPTLKGRQGGAVHTVASASDGIQIFPNSGNITAGTFTLYKVV